MVWDETADPAVIVMLTQTHESGREKCFQYFPESLDDPVLPINEEDEFGDDFQAVLTLKSVTEVDEVRSTVREIELKTKDGRTKTVWHLLFSVWPDFLVPEGDDRVALLRLIRLTQERNTHAESPRIVHCSAGVGRSGTFIALDWLIAELDAGSFDEVQNDDDPIADLVDTLRQQRMMMVQGDQQFLFIYDTMRDLWLARWNQRTATQ
jgi:protein-tyrosine phosphatase